MSAATSIDGTGKDIGSDRALLRRLAILGAGGHGRSVADVAEACGWVPNLYDDGWPDITTSGPWPIVGDTAALIANLHATHGGCYMVAIGDNASRLEKHQCLSRLQHARAVTLVHPLAFVSPRAAMGAGCVVMAMAAVNVGSRLGDACIINTGATVDHDCTLAAGVHVSPGAHLAGTISVGMCAWVGMGACIKQRLHIGACAVVGAGATVVKPVASGACVTGCPAEVHLKRGIASGACVTGCPAEVGLNRGTT